MGPAAIGVMAGGALLGGISGAQNAKAASQPTKTTESTTPWSPDLASEFYNQQHRDWMNANQNVNWGPSAEQNALWAQMMGFNNKGGGGGGQQGPAQPQGPTGPSGPRGPGIYKRLAGNNVALSDYEKRVLGDEFLNLDANPYIQQRLDAMRREQDESAERAYGQALTPFIQGGGTMGMSGAAIGQRGIMADDFNENLLNQQSGFLGDQYQFERGMQDAANQTWSGREQTYDSSAFAHHADIKQANIAAAAQRYAVDQQMAAQRAAQAAAGRQAEWSRMMDLYGLASNRAGDYRNAQGLGAMNINAGYSSSALPWQQAFGTTTGVQQGPKYSSFMGGLTGGLGGGMAGFGMAGNMGMKNFFGSQVGPG